MASVPLRASVLRRILAAAEETPQQPLTGRAETHASYGLFRRDFDQVPPEGCPLRCRMRALPFTLLPRFEIAAIASS
jgi:hypothetical protein